MPDEVFHEPFVPPVSDGSGQDRALLRKAQQLLEEAGLPVKDRKRLLPSGEVFSIEFLLDEPTFQPHHASFIKNLAMLGIDANIRLIDAVQFRARVEDFDFDITVERLSMSATPGDSLRPYFTSQSAATRARTIWPASPAPPSTRWSPKRSPPRRGRPDLCLRAIDRLFRAGRYWIPQWYRSNHPLAYWDMFDHPEQLPRYAPRAGVPEIWWYDAAKAAKLDQAR